MSDGWQVPKSRTVLGAVDVGPPLVDTAPLLALLLVPILGAVLRRRSLAVLFFVLLAWSVLVQIVGAFAYDFAGWNARVVAYDVFVEGRSGPFRVESRAEVDRLAAAQPVLRVEEVRANIDRPEHRPRLWDLRDTQIGYYLMHFGESREKKQQEIEAWSRRWH